MNRNVERILVACLLSFIGTLVAKQLGLYWWGGLIFGFGAGYLGYDFRAVLSAIPPAFAKACDGVTDIPVRHILQYLFYTFGGFFSILLTIASAIFFLIITHPAPFRILGICEFLGWVALGATVFMTLLFSGESRESRIDSHINDMKMLVQYTHPLSFPFYAISLFVSTPPLVGGAAIWLIGKIPMVCQFFWTFTRHIFFQIHSTPRLLFGIDVAIGVAIGCYTGNALIGGLAGGVWWLMDWHLISVKWMKLQPTR